IASSRAGWAVGPRSTPSCPGGPGAEAAGWNMWAGSASPSRFLTLKLKKRQIGMSEKRCRQRKPQRNPFDYIIARRVIPGETEPGPGALKKPCSDCGHEVWINPLTAADTGGNNNDEERTAQHGASQRHRQPGPLGDRVRLHVLAPARQAMDLAADCGGGDHRLEPGPHPLSPRAADAEAARSHHPRGH